MIEARWAWPGLLSPAGSLPPDRVAVTAAGTRITYADGVTRLCGTSGLWNVNLGYGHPRVAAAVVQAAAVGGYLSAFRYSHELLEKASVALLGCLDRRFERVVWVGSGASAVEASITLSRQAHALAGAASRRLVVSLVGSYHGVSIGAAAVTGDDVLQRLYGVDQREVRQLAPADAGGLRRLVDRDGDRIACIVVEPVLGTGTVPLPGSLLEALRYARQRGIHVVADEVATGFGRTGPLFAHERWPLVPDMVVTSKGLTNGAAPGAAVAVSGAIASTYAEHGAVLLHAETAGGHPLAAAAALAVVEEFTTTDVLARGEHLGARLGDLLDDVIPRLPGRARHVGAGCFRTLHWDMPDGSTPDQPTVAATVDEARRQGVVVHPGPGGIQLVPALVMSDDDLEALVAAAERAVATVGARSVAA